MGIRFTQPQGISKDAREFLNNHRAHQNDCPHCGRSDIVPADKDVVGGVIYVVRKMVG